MISFLLTLPVPSSGEDCLIGVEVSPYQVNIDSGGVEHYVRVLTYAQYGNTAYAFVYIDENEDSIDSEYIELTRDSVGHLVIKIDLNAIQDADLQMDTYYDLNIVVGLKTPEGVECKGTGEIYIVGKRGEMKR